MDKTIKVLQTMTFGSIPSIESLDECLSDPANPIGMRMRAAYYLRHIHSTAPTDQDIVVSILEKGLLQPRHGSLLRHEFAYVMGQMKDQRVSYCLILKVRAFNFKSYQYRIQVSFFSDSPFCFHLTVAFLDVTLFVV
jgi:hypothetical protein